MPKDFEIEPSGYKGEKFEAIGHLLAALDSKKTQDAIKDLSEFEPDQWAQLRDSTNALIQVGRSLDPGIIQTTIDTLAEHIENKTNQLMNDWLKPYLPQIIDLLNAALDLIDFIFQGLEGFRQALEWVITQNSVISGGLFREFDLIQDEIRRVLAQRLLEAGEFAEDRVEPETQQDVRNIINRSTPSSRRRVPPSEELPKNYG